VKPVLLFAFVLAAGHVPPATAQDALANAHACAAEPDDARRLACYDKQFRRGANQPSQPKAVTPTAPVDAASAEQRFGMNGQVERNTPGTQAPTLDKLTEHVAAIWHKPRGEAVFKLENGQTWEEADGEIPIYLKVGDAVTINAGVMGAYWVVASTGSVRVKRTH
jgi:hypothetical protein